MEKDNYKYSEITEKIIGCSMKVHNFFGSGFPEVIYQRSLKIEFEKSGLNYSRELELPVYYEKELVGSRVVDFLIEDKIIVELKVVPELIYIHQAQILNYLKAFKKEVGLLINFGESRLKFKRFVI
ncbi:MAG: GxxExxY protein [Bacteroidetes bacterium]|nr:GxxExxY protein [Bacteroidota bacterium]